LQTHRAIIDKINNYGKNNIPFVLFVDFLMNETKSPENNFTDDMNHHEDIMGESEELTEKKKKNTATNQKLWKASLAWAKSRYKVCPSAYCNGAAVKHYNSKGGNWVKK
jgi:hypothetical protein